MPNSLNNLNKLKTLDLSGNKLRSFNENLDSLASLEVLYLGNNELTSLPESIGSFLSLKRLNIRNNNLKTVPDSIASLSSLQSLFLKGNKIAALGVTEPSGGSDVANLSTKAILCGNHYVVNGSKMFITSGFRANQLTCAVRTGGEGYRGISFLVIDSDTPGYSVSEKFEKMGWWASDTAQIFFDECKVPADNLLGKEGQGFYLIMENFQHERLQLSIMANMTSQLALEESIQYVKEKVAPKQPFSTFQVTRHKLADMATLVEASREFVYRVAAKIEAGLNQVKEISMAKNFSCMVSDQVTYDASQIHGRFGYLREYLVERLSRDNRILSIGGGTTEIMKEVIAKYIVEK